MFAAVSRILGSDDRCFQYSARSPIGTDRTDPDRTNPQTDYYPELLTSVLCGTPATSPTRELTRLALMNATTRLSRGERTVVRAGVRSRSRSRPEPLRTAHIASTRCEVESVGVGVWGMSTSRVRQHESSESQVTLPARCARPTSQRSPSPPKLLLPQPATNHCNSATTRVAGLAVQTYRRGAPACRSRGTNQHRLRETQGGSRSTLEKPTLRR